MAFSSFPWPAWCRSARGTYFKPSLLQSMARQSVQSLSLPRKLPSCYTTVRPKNSSGNRFRSIVPEEIDMKKHLLMIVASLMFIAADKPTPNPLPKLDFVHSVGGIEVRFEDYVFRGHKMTFDSQKQTLSISGNKDKPATVEKRVKGQALRQYEAGRFIFSFQDKSLTTMN
jgi:hypothetical protein